MPYEARIHYWASPERERECVRGVCEKKQSSTPTGKEACGVADLSVPVYVLPRSDNDMLVSFSPYAVILTDYSTLFRFPLLRLSFAVFCF